LAHDKVNEVVVGPEIFNTAKYPLAHYRGTLGGFVDGVPTTATGNLTMHGVTKPLDLKVKSFKCMPHPMYKHEVCGADALGTLHRDEFGIDSGKAYGFNMEVTLRIQVEAINAN
jgi:polyisoprenoid-binding protein YceI